MMRPLTTAQKIIAYGSLVFIFFWIAFGLFAIGLILTEG